MTSRYAPDTLPPPAPAWEHAALCRTPGTDPRWWDADSVTSPAGAEAAAVCWICPSRLACLAAALTEEGAKGPEHRGGIWGGLDGHQRHAHHRSQTRRTTRARDTAVEPP